jgi:hypothetical protein
LFEKKEKFVLKELSGCAARLLGGIHFFNGWLDILE